MAQGSEFAFVIFAALGSALLVDTATTELLGSLVGLSLAVTPLLAAGGCILARSCVRRDDPEPDLGKDEREIIIVGFDDFGQRIADAFEAAGIVYRAHERDWSRIAYARSRGFQVHYSDPSRPRTLSRASTGQVRAVVSLLEDDAVVRQLTAGLRQVAPDIPVTAATSDPSRLELLFSLGLEHAYIKSEQSLPILVDEILKSCGATTEQRERAAQVVSKVEDTSAIPRGLLDFASAAA